MSGSWTDETEEISLKQLAVLDRITQWFASYYVWKVAIVTGDAAVNAGVKLHMHVLTLLGWPKTGLPAQRWLMTSLIRCFCPL